MSRKALLAAGAALSAVAMLMAGQAHAQFSTVGVGGTAGDGTGDPLRTAFQKINTNFGQVPPQVFLATKYGAVFDAKTLSDITTTSGSTSVSSASYTFTSADVGKSVSIWAGSSTSVSGTITSGSYQITGLSSTTGIEPGTYVNAAGIPTGTIVSGILGANTVVINQKPTATSTGTINFVASLNTTIASVSGGNAVLATAPTSTFSAGTGPNAVMIFGTDSTAAIQAAVNAASAAGSGTVVLPLGRTMISSAINWASNVSLVGQGQYSSGLIWSSTSNMGTATTSAMLWGGNGTALAPYQNIVFKDFEINMDSAHEGGTLTYLASCTSIAYSVNWVVENTYMHGSPASCIRNDYARGNIIVNNTFAHTGRLSDGLGSGGNSIGSTYAESIYYPTSGIVANNYIYDPGVTGILYQNTITTTNSKSDSVTIDNNYIYYDAYTTNAYPNNISGINEEGGYQAVISNNVVIGPPVANPYVVGIQNGLGDNGVITTNAPSQGGIISNNTVQGMGEGIAIKDLGTVGYTISNNYISLAGNDSCIKISGGSSNSYKGLAILNNVGYRCVTSGLGFYSAGTTMSGIKISGNDFHDNGYGQTGYNSAGISFSLGGASFTDVTISDNKLYDSGLAAQKYGLGLNSSSNLTGVVFSGNNLTGNTTLPFAFSTSTITGVFNNNFGMPAPTVSGCSATSPVGNGDIGSYLSGTTGSCVATITPYGTTSIVANNGHVCEGNDLTTPASSIQSGDTTTTATLTTNTTSGDKVNFMCRMW